MKTIYQGFEKKKKKKKLGQTNFIYISSAKKLHI